MKLLEYAQNGGGYFSPVSAPLEVYRVHYQDENNVCCMGEGMVDDRGRLVLSAFTGEISFPDDTPINARRLHPSFPLDI